MQDEYGLATQMKMVLHWHARAKRALSVRSVHDLRKSIRRCRSLADGLMAVDPDPRWRKMKKTGKNLFKALGRLRDLHIMAVWLKRLAPGEDAAATKLRKALQKEAIRKRKRSARRSLGSTVRSGVSGRKSFPSERRWDRTGANLQSPGARSLPGSSRRAPSRSPRAHARNLASGSHRRQAVSLYRGELLPELREALGPQLEKVQDLLGEVHDLHVLWIALTETGRVFDKAEHRAWGELIEREQNARLEEYRKLTRGRIPSGPPGGTRCLEVSS